MANERKLRILIDSSGAKTGGKEVTKEMGKIISSAKIATKTFEDLKNAMKGLMSGGGSKAAASNKALKDQADILKGMDAHVKALSDATNTLAKSTVNQQAVLHDTNKELRQSATAIKLKTKLEFDSLKASEQSTAEYLQQAEALYRQQKATKSLIDSMKQRVDAEGKIAPIVIRATKEQEAHNNIIARTASLERTLNTVRDGSYGKMVAAEKALRDEKKAILESLNARTSEQKQLAASTKAREKLENTMYAEQARTEALKSEMGRQSVKIQEQRRLVEELARSKERLNMVNSREYAELVKTRKAIEDKNKQLREMGRNVNVSSLSVSKLSSAFSVLGTTLASVGAYFSVLAIARTADDYTNITNKLKAVSGATIDFTNATRDLLDLSIDSRSSLEGTMEIYSKMTRVNEDLGKSQTEVRDLTEAVSKAVAMSGASVQGSQGSLMQFAQAMSGDFKSSGQELNSILEQTPLLAVAMAKGLRLVTGNLDITTGSLKKMAEAGELSTELVFESMLKILPDLRKQFESTDQTMASAAEGLKSSFTVMVGELDKTYGLSATVTEAMKELGEIMKDNGDTILTLTASITGLLGAAALGGLLAILASIGPIILGLVGAVGLLTGAFVSNYLEANKYNRALDEQVKKNKLLKSTTDDFIESLQVIGTVKIVDNIKTIGSEITSLSNEIQGLNLEMRGLEDPILMAATARGLDTDLLSLRNSQSDIFKASAKMESANTKASLKKDPEYLQLQKLIEEKQKAIDLKTKQLQALQEELPKALLRRAESEYASLYDMSKNLMNNDSKSLKEYEKDLQAIASASKRASDAASEAGIDSGQVLSTTLNAQQAALDKYIRSVPTLTRYLNEQNSESDYRLAADLKLQEDLDEINNLHKAGVELLKAQWKVQVPTTQEAEKQLEVLKKQKEEATNLAKKRKEALLFEQTFGVSGEDMASTFTNALLTKDWSSFGSMIGSSIGTALNNSITSSLTASGIAGASIWGAIGGSIATTVIGGILAGKKQTGSSTTVSLSGGGVSGYDETRYKSFFGSSKTFTSLLDTTTKQIDKSLSASINTVNNSLSKMGSSLVVSFEDFNYSTTVGSGDFTTAMDNITNAYVEANLAYIEDFQKVNQTALDALQDLSSKMNTVQSSFLIGSNGSIASAAERYIQSQASQLQGSYQDAYRNAILERETLKATLAGKLTEFNKNPYMGSRESSQYDDYLSRQGVLKEGLDAIRGRINELDGVINESLSRLGTSLSEASAKFSDTVISTISSLEGIDSEGAKARLGELASNYETTFYSLAEQAERAASRAAISLSDYADLGVNASMSLREFRDAFDNFVNSPAFSPEGYSRWLLASEAMTSLSKANEALSEATTEGAVNLSDEISKATNDAFSNILDWINKIQGTSTDGYVSLQTAQAQFQTQLALARSGNADALSTITQYADTVLEAAKRSVNTSEQFGNIKSSIISSVSNIPKFADGGYHSGGLRLVGENGPEIEYTGSSNIYNNSQMEKIFDTSGIERRLENMEQVMRSGLFAVAKNTGKSTELMRRWEGDGLPAERVYA